MFKQKIAIISLLGLFLMVSGPASALAHVSIDTDEKNYAPMVGNWEEYGNVNVTDDGRVRITQKGSQSGHLFTDVNIPNNDDYLVFVSYTRAENPYPNFSNGTENITGLPYLYAYLLDDGKIIEYVSETSMRQSAAVGKTWQVTYGIVYVPSNSESMRLFLKQALNSNVTPDGRTAVFYKPGLYFADSYSEAYDVVEAYSDELNEVKDDFGPEYNHTNNNTNNNPDYPVDTLIKCPTEPEIYSVTSSTTIKLFPNEETFYAWGHSFAEVKNVSCARIDDYTVIGTWTYERADYLVKFHNQSAVYTLDNDKYLRLIPDEYTAYRMYGSHWTRLIREYPVSEMRDYFYGVPHQSLR
ncbi:MAG: hypothetical protein V1664_03780 [Candidatus Uhrbacteria bacterium]